MCNPRTNSGFDAFSRPLTQTLPSGEVLNYAYNAMGVLSSLSGTNTYVSQINYNASGQMTDEFLGNGLMQQSCYDANTLRLTGIRAYPGALVSCTNLTPANAPLNLSYTYQANGNQTKRIVNGQTLRQAQGIAFNLAYDAENRLVSVSGATTASFVYDGDGKQVKATVGGTTTYYVGSIYEVTGSTVTKYYFAGAQRVAMRAGSTLTYLLGDHLGSTSLSVNTSGALVSELRYKPWGETRYTSGTMATDYQFTSQRNEVSLGLYFYNARWYDSYLNHFTQPDSIVSDPSNPQSLDRYAYTLNNPLRYTDPSGHSEDCAVGEAGCHAGKLISGGLFLTGTMKDIQRVVNVLNDSLNGYTVSVDGEGRLRIQQTGDSSSQTPGQMVMHNYLSKYINSDGRTQMSVVSGSSDIIGDDWPTETLDIEDIEAFGSAPGVSSASSLVHAFEEQYQKQVNGIEDPNIAHNDYAVPAEEAVAGATRSDKVERSGSLIVSVTITYEYPGDILFYTTIYTDPFTITKHGCDPIRKMCY